MRKSAHTRAYKVLCDELIAARNAADLSQQELADLLGRPQSFIAKYELRERRLDLVEVLEIASLLGADVRAIIRAVSAAIPSKP